MGFFDFMERAAVAPRQFSTNVTQNSFNDFDFPPPSGANGLNNSIFTLGDTLDLRWHTQYTSSDLYLMQLDSSASPITIAQNIQTQSYVWTVTTGAFDIATSNVFYFRIQDHVYGGIFGSSFLNFTESGTPVSLGFPTSSTTSSSSTSTSTSSATTTTSSSTSTGIASETASPAASQTATSSPVSHSSSLSGGAIGGIAVGAVAVVALLVAGWFFGYWKRRKNASSPNRPELAGGEQVYQYQYPAEPKQQYVAYSKPPAEMGSNAPGTRNNQTRPYEMGG